MTPNNTSCLKDITQSISWQKLADDASKPLSLNALFSHQQDSLSRAADFTVSASGITLDYSKQLITDGIRDNLVALAHQAQLTNKIHALMSGEVINITEKRAALHTALRLEPSDELIVDGKDINPAIQASLEKARQIVDKIRQKVWRGFSGAAITDVVNIGVGGSDLGPLMVSTALDEFGDAGIRLHFASNMDGTQIDQLLKALKPETTLFIVASKSFSTIDTLSNANTALKWLLERCPKPSVVLKNHFIGVSANVDKMHDWGIVPENQLVFWDWVGGRFSLWSVIGLSVAIKIGMSKFYELLEGARAMDRHFQVADFFNNLPVMMGLLGVWNSSFLNIHAHAILPYDGRLKYLPNYLTQLEMESNGKSIKLDGSKVRFNTAPIIWGDVGSNAQHAFYQLLHQGTQRVSSDFIAPIARYGGQAQERAHDDSLIRQHNLALANCLAQSRVLAFGNHALGMAQDISAHKLYRGNQPSSTILLDELNPFTLGALLALYEHKVFVMSVVWGINPFDQWGVEIGKVMASDLLTAIQQQTTSGYDVSTNALLSKIINNKHKDNVSE